jgi:hypothetical protein
LPFTEEQILNLAPDDASKKSGKELASPNKWVSKGVNELAIWGEAQGSGSKPYQTQIDIVNIAFKCSCPSRKFPCKHGIGLMLYNARQPDSFTESEAPAWVIEWINKRSEKEEKKITQEVKPVDEQAQQKRQEARNKKVADGVSELLIWLKDIVRNGIVSMPDKGYSYFDNMAKRMVDAQAPGLANLIKALGETNFFSDAWQSKFVDQLATIYLIAKTYQTQSPNNEELLQEIKNWIGYTQNQDDLKAQTGIEDTWLILCKQTTTVDNISTEKTWLYGTTCNQYALVLQFNIRGQGSQYTFTPGMYIQAELVYFSAAIPLRAIIKRQIASNVNGNYAKFDNWQAVCEHQTALTTKMPCKNEQPYIVADLKLVQYNNVWWLQDKNQSLMQIKKLDGSIWKILAISGGKTLDMVVIGKEDLFEPVGIWNNNVYHSL